MPIQPTEPIVIPQKTADKLWITSLHIISPNPLNPTRGHITIAPCVSDNNNEIITSLQKSIVIDDLFSEVESNPKLAAAIQAIFEAVDSMVKSRGLF